MSRIHLLAVAAVYLLICSPCPGQHPHDVVWTTPSEDAHGSMPLGNGDIALNAWVESDGALIFYIAKGDAWSDNGRLLKVGRVRVTTDPPAATESFVQRLDLHEGTMIVKCGIDDDAVICRLWVDANNPMIHVAVECGSKRTATASIELWRTEPQPYPAAECSDLLEDRSKPNRLHREVIVEPDTIVKGLDDRIGWYHHNVKSVGPALIARLQGLEDYFEGKEDPLLHRTFGAIITSPKGERLDDTHLRSPAGTSHRFDLHVLTAHPCLPEAWLSRVDSLIMKVGKTPFVERRAAHEKWWRDFWNRSWIHVTGTGKPTLVPRNSHPVRIGIDQHEQNRFVGEIGRVTILPFPLGDSEIAGLAQVETGSMITDYPQALYHDLDAGTIAIDRSSSWSFGDGLTIEAWVKPGEMPAGGGRIVDKTTPGASDGFLLDTYPGRSLRLIVGNDILTERDVLPRDAWSHVAAVINPGTGRIALLLNGEVIASTHVEALDEATLVSRAYALQRYVSACAGRGQYPIKFNGSLFTVPFEGKFGDADYRRWGPGYWWQNTRLPYLSMCASGDFEMMRPFFRMYADELMPLHRFRTEKYTGHGGAFIPECIYFFGPTFTATYGWSPYEERGEDKLQESGWHKWEWVSGPELVWMMLDYYDHTLDESFLRETLLPTAHEILTFFDLHYDTDERGKLVMFPSQAVETWWDCTNPMPEVAGLRAVTARLLALPPHLVKAERRSFWTRFRKKIPELPTWEKDGVALLAPAERFAEKRNVENPELYAVFPFRLVSFEKPNAALGVAALENRWDRGSFGWRQDDLFMTHLGLTRQAREFLVNRAKNKHDGSRFPVFWGPNYDWVPDQDHGGVLLRTLQTMLMQTEGKAIHLFPAWPKEWQVRFKLRAPFETTVSGIFEDGEIKDLKVRPRSRRDDVVIHQAEATSRRGVPTPEQIAWHEMEIEMFVCLDPCTWQGREYDNHSTPLSAINPENLDTDQWCEVARTFGAKQILFVAKHTGGFCWWQTGTTEYSIRNTPYKGGKGDVLAELSESCRKYGLKLAVYIYPGDDQWGAGIGSGGRTADPARQEEYNKVLRQQWTEVLSRYGEVSEVWFDGSCVIEVGDILEKHAPGAMVFQGPHATLRWVGNERGTAPYPLWQTVKRADAESGVATDRHSDPDGDVWLPVEVDTTLLDHKWFWGPGTDQMIKPLDHLVDIYYKSVGRGGVLLLNSTPATSGRIPESHVRRYREFGERIRGIYRNRKGETAGRGKEIELRFDGPTAVDHLVLMEDIRFGQIVRAYEVDGLIKGKWHSLVTGLSIGYKRIDVIEEVVASALRLRVTESIDTPVIKSFAAYEVRDPSSQEEGGRTDADDRPWDPVAGWKADALTAGWQTFDVDLTSWIGRPGQYEVRLHPAGGGGTLEVRNVVVVMGGTEAPRLITPLDEPKAWNINRTAQVVPGKEGQTLLRFQARIVDGMPWHGELQIRSGP